MKTLAEQKHILNQTLTDLNNQDINNDSNFKFMNLLRSRLMEEGINQDDAVRIVSLLDYDLSPVNEDDDYLGDVALAYAEFAAKVYTRLNSTGWTRFLSDALIKKYFCKTPICL